MNKLLAAQKRINTEYYSPAVRPKPEPVKQPRFKARVAVKRVTVLLMLFTCFALGIVVIAQYSSMITLHYRLSTADTRIRELSEEYRALEQEAAELSALSRIELVARTELGMREPEYGQLRVLTAGQEDGVHVGE